MSKDSQKVKVNKAVGQGLDIAGFSENLALPLIGFGFIAVTITLVFETSWKLFLFMFLTPSLTYIILVGKKGHRFIERFRTPRRFIFGNYWCEFVPNHPLPTTRCREKIVIMNFWKKHGN